MNGLLSSPSTPATRLDTDTLIGALEGLRRFLSGQKATLVWDGLAAHRSKPKRAWPGRQRSWLVVEPLAGYPPSSTRSNRWGPAKTAPSWPTWPATPWRRSSRRPSVASADRATPHLPLSCATMDCPYGENYITGTATFVGIAHAGSL
jgi:hypothetical protein